MSAFKKPDFGDVAPVYFEDWIPFSSGDSVLKPISRFFNKNIVTVSFKK
jgi:hypothetical protein